MPTYKRADLSRVLPAVRCTARKQNGEPCRAMAARGATVCRVHGGSAPQVKAAAKRRLDQAADVLVQRLLGFALGGDVADAIALAAVRDALDRAGLSPRQAVEVGVELKPWEQIMANIAFSGIAQITREEHRARLGLPADEPPALPTPEVEFVDAEVVPEPEPHTYRPSAAVEAAGRPGRPDAPADESAASTARRVAPPVSVTYEEAAALMRESRVRTALVRRERQVRRRRVRW